MLPLRLPFNYKCINHPHSLHIHADNLRTFTDVTLTSTIVRVSSIYIHYLHDIKNNAEDVRKEKKRWPTIKTTYNLRANSINDANDEMRSETKAHVHTQNWNLLTQHYYVGQFHTHTEMNQGASRLPATNYLIRLETLSGDSLRQWCTYQTRIPLSETTLQTLSCANAHDDVGLYNLF